VFQLDAGVHLKRVAHTETDSNTLSYKIPSHADFLVSASAILIFFSFFTVQLFKSTLN
jgi:hypothetical protein